MRDYFIQMTDFEVLMLIYIFWLTRAQIVYSDSKIYSPLHNDKFNINLI